MKLPLSVEAISREWLEAALRQRHPQISVARFQIEEILWGTATKIRIKVEYERQLTSQEPPEALCIKGGFSEELRPIIAEMYQKEALFFAEVAPKLGAPLPRCWFAGADAERAQGIFILDDLLAAGARFGDPLHPWSVDQVAAALEIQAQWHGRSWNASPVDYPQLSLGSPVREPTKMLLSEAHWKATFDATAAPRIPSALQDRAKVYGAMSAMWKRDDEQGIPCVAHADAHVGNTYHEAQGAPRFIDWQSVCLAPAIDDVGYFIGGALSVAHRRQSERTLLAHYLDVLAVSGGPRLSFDEAWLGYRQHCIHGFLWAVTPPSMQSAERVLAMADRYVAAIEDHEALKL